MKKLLFAGLMAVVFAAPAFAKDVQRQAPTQYIIIERADHCGTLYNMMISAARDPNLSGEAYMSYRDAYTRCERGF